jgi:hypothetical protein
VDEIAIETVAMVSAKAGGGAGGKIMNHERDLFA